MSPLFNLRYSRGFQANHIPKGNFADLPNPFFSTFACPARPAIGRFSRSRLRACRGGACIPRRQCGSPPGSVARAPGVQSRAIRQVTTGSLSAGPGPTRPIESPKCHIFHFSPLSATVSEGPPQQPSKARQARYNSRASNVSLRHSHERCFCVCIRQRAFVRVCVIVGSYKGVSSPARVIPEILVALWSRMEIR